MRKTVRRFWLMSVILFLLNPIKSFAWGMDEVSEAAEETFKAWLDQYTLDSVDEEERLKIYYLSSYSAFNTYEEFTEGGDLVVKMGAIVYPVKENSSKWSQYEKLTYENPKDGVGYIFPETYMRMKKVGEKYEIVYMDVVPEGYEAYVENMKEKGIDVENLDLEKLLYTEYEETTEITEQNAQVQELKAENKIVEKTKMGIIIFFSLMIIVILTCYIRQILYKK